MGEESYNKLFVTLDSPTSVQKITEQLESRGYHVTSLQKEFKEIGTGLMYAGFALSLFSVIIITTSLLLVGSTVFTSLMRRSKELGILRSTGATRRELTILFVLKYGSLGGLGGLLGAGLGQGITAILQELLSNNLRVSSIEIRSIFITSPALISAVIGGAVLLCTIVSLIPISKILQRTPKSLFEAV